MEILAEVLGKNEDLVVDGMLDKNMVAELARKYDKGLLIALCGNKDLKKLFFEEIDGQLVFKKDIFLQFISQKEFLPDSYTKFSQKIGLATTGGDLLANDNRVILNWPYKDCVLEGGQTKEDQKRDEVFFNEILAPDQISTILEDKVFTNWKRYDKNGEHKLDELKPNDNLIIKGNNLVILHSLKKRFAGRVKLIYIDPPYNTGSDSFGYNDRFNHSSWLTFMKNRLSVAKELLADNGAIFVQCDDNEQAYLKVLMDEVFIDTKYDFDSTIVMKVSPANGVKVTHADKKILKEKEFVLFYKGNTTKIKPQYIENAEYDWHYNLYWDNNNEVIPLKDKLAELNIPADDRNSKFIDYIYKNADRIFQQVAAPEAIKNNREYDEKIIKPVKELPGYYAYNGGQVHFLAKNIKPTLNGNKLAQLACDWWPDISFNNLFREGGVSLKAGKKPEKLLARIISLITEPGDIVLDYHLGCGTTAAVAHKMGRQYIGIEQLYYGDDDSIVRLKNVIDGDDTGISKLVNWAGGGSFVYCNIKNDANIFREKVNSAKETDLCKLLDEVLKSSFLSYRVDPKKVNKKEFEKLSLTDKRRILHSLVDNNTLYMNYSEIDDASYDVSTEDKKFNKQFYTEIG